MELMLACLVRSILFITIFIHRVGIAISRLIADTVETINLSTPVAAAQVPCGLKIEHSVMVGSAYWRNAVADSIENEDGMIAGSPE